VRENSQKVLGSNGSVLEAKPWRYLQGSRPSSSFILPVPAAEAPPPGTDLLQQGQLQVDIFSFKTLCVIVVCVLGQ